MLLKRRRLITGASAALAAPALIRSGRAETTRTPAELTLILMGDLHSGYAWSARLLAAVRNTVRTADGEVRIVINGDVFEHNNVLARRNDGRIDLTLIRQFCHLAPTIVTIGNHDSDLTDPRQFVADIRAAGATVLTDITDPRSGQLYGAPDLRIRTPTLTTSVVSLGTPDMDVYPKEYRSDYGVPDPATYAAGTLPSLTSGADLTLALVHAGFRADRRVLPFLKPPFILHGSHDHLRFSEHLAPDALHLQSGAWCSTFQVVSVSRTADGICLSSRDVVLSQDDPEDAALASLVADERACLLTAEDRRVLGHFRRSMSTDESAMWLAHYVRNVTDADLALLSHTTFGDGIEEGAVTTYDRDSFLRFDGGFSVAELKGDVILRHIIPATNQFDGKTPYRRRTGDYLYLSRCGCPIDPDRTYQVVINSYPVHSAQSMISYFGATLDGFTPVPALSMSGILNDALSTA